MTGLRKGVMLTLGALVCGAGAAYLAKHHITSEVAASRAEISAEYRTTRAVVAKRDIAAGVPVGNGDVAVREVPRTFLHASAVRPDQWPSVAGRALTEPVNAGEPILTAHLSRVVGAGFSARIRDGYRALTIPVDAESSISGMLAPGDRIDLLTTLSEASDSFTFPLLTNDAVVATGRRTNNRSMPEGVTSYRNVTISVKPSDAAKITHAMDVGRVTVALRAKGDTSPVSDYRIDKGSLLGEIDPESDSIAPVEIIIGGRE